MPSAHPARPGWVTGFAQIRGVFGEWGKREMDDGLGHKPADALSYMKFTTDNDR